MLYVSYSPLFLMSRRQQGLLFCGKNITSFVVGGGCAIDWLIFRRLSCRLVERFLRPREKFFLTSGLLLLAP